MNVEFGDCVTYFEKVMQTDSGCYGSGNNDTIGGNYIVDSLGEFNSVIYPGELGPTWVPVHLK